jgi:hypothetical protein
MAVTLSGGTPTFSSGYAGGTIISGTAVASTSGTSIDFTSIPSWVKRVTFMFNGVSTNGGAGYLIQLGSGSITTSGYVSTSLNLVIGSAIGGASSTAGFLEQNYTGSFTHSGSFIITNVSGNIWVAQGVTKADTNAVMVSGGNVTLSGTLDRLRLTTTNGTDTFDAGSINILYE